MGDPRCAAIKLCDVGLLRPGLVSLHHDALGGATNGGHEGATEATGALNAGHDIRHGPAQSCSLGGQTSRTHMGGWSRCPCAGLLRPGMGPRNGPANVVEGNAGVALGPHQGTLSVQRDRGAVCSIGVADSIGLWLHVLAGGRASWQGDIRTDTLRTQQSAVRLGRTSKVLAKCLLKELAKGESTIL